MGSLAVPDEQEVGMAKSPRGRMVRSQAEAFELLAEFEASGERISDWCAARSINWYSLNAYQSRRAIAGTRESEFVELTVATSSVPAETARYQVRVCGVEIEVDDQFREDTLVRLLGVLATC